MSKTSWSYLLSSLVLALSMTACAVGYPVQEMSNARQTLQAAQEVQAEIHAPNLYKEARRLLDMASSKLEEGDYQSARELAVSAKQYAIKARLEAIGQQQK